MIPPPALAVTAPAVSWAHRRWSQFAATTAAERAATLVLAPVCGFADWGDNLPLDAEEVVAMAVLDAALAPGSGAPTALVLPPLRHVLAPGPRGRFGVDAETAHAFLAEVVRSVAAAGHRRVIFYNASPLNEDLVDAAARDLRINDGMQMFCVNLSALRLDFDPARQPERAALLALVAHALGRSSPAGGVALAGAAAHLTALLHEIAARGPLPHGGRILSKGPHA